MSPERFAVLADAYGGRIERWPEVERTAARVFANRHPDLATPILSRAAQLDAELASWRVPGPGSVLAADILAGMDRGCGRWSPRLRLLLSGFGGAATLAAGIAAGLMFAGPMPPPSDPVVGQFYETSVLGEAVAPSDPAGSQP